MKNLVPMDDFGVFADSSATVKVSSLMVAEIFRPLMNESFRKVAKSPDSFPSPVGDGRPYNAFLVVLVNICVGAI